VPERVRKKAMTGTGRKENKVKLRYKFYILSMLEVQHRIEETLGKA